MASVVEISGSFHCLLQWFFQAEETTLGAQNFVADLDVLATSHFNFETGFCAFGFVRDGMLLTRRISCSGNRQGTLLSSS